MNACTMSGVEQEETGVTGQFEDREVGTVNTRREGPGQAMTGREALCAVLAGALAFVLNGCGGAGGVPGVRDDATAAVPARILQTKKFAVDQPVVLRQIGVHHAYARGLTGDKIRIGIDDTFVDFTQRDEFEGRVERDASEGARLADNGGTLDSEILEQIETCRKRVTCEQWIDTLTLGTKYDISLEYARDWMLVRYDSDGEKDIENAIVEELVGLGLHEYLISEHILLHDMHQPASDDPVAKARAWATAPNPYIATHGTAVASVAAGTRLGVAPGAMIVPTTRNLSGYDWLAPGLVPAEVRTAIEDGTMSATARNNTDMTLATEQRAIYENADVINRSWGIVLGTRAISAGEIGAQEQWYMANLPKLLDAYLQKDTLPEDRTIVVYAAGNRGNRGQDRPAGEAQLPYHVEELRGHTLAVVATDPATRRIAYYSNSCGPLPLGWSDTDHGPHYCLAAPGTMQVRVPDPAAPGHGTSNEWQGTSFAAPLVSGAIALMMEHFRDTMGNTAIVRRMLDTANNEGVYADAQTYGAGHLDLEAALSPQGTLSAGPDARPLAATALVTPSAYGALGRRVDAELAAFDAGGFPFWIPLGERIATRATSQSPIPAVDEAQAPGAPAIDGARWTAIEPTRVQTEAPLWFVGAGEGTAGIGREPTSRHWGYGFAASSDGAFAARGEGAFDAGTHAGLIWASGAANATIGANVGVKATATIAMSASAHERSAVFETSPVLMSALAVRAGNDRTSLTVRQPLRAEAGNGVFHLENGHTEDGRRLRDAYRVRLKPEGREMRATLRHEVEGRRWKVAFEATAAIDAGHVPGERDVAIGAVFRRRW